MTKSLCGQALIIAHERSSYYGDLLDCVKAAVFFGVPHRGADLAYWAAFLSNILKTMLLGFATRTTFVEALKRNSPTFADISQQFIERGAKLKIITFYETQKLRGQLVSFQSLIICFIEHCRLASCRSLTDLLRFWDWQTSFLFPWTAETTYQCASSVILRVRSICKCRGPSRSW
jgi:hypothetical protein